MTGRLRPSREALLFAKYKYLHICKNTMIELCTHLLMRMAGLRNMGGFAMLGENGVFW